MIEALLVLPFIAFTLSLVVYFGLSMQRTQRAVMMDRYESWRGSDRAPGPSVGLGQSAGTLQIADAFLPDTNARLRVESSDFFPVEAQEDWQQAASERNTGAGRLASQYFEDLPRGRSLRFFISDTTGIPLWDRLFPEPIHHRHTAPDTDWRFTNYVLEGFEWFDDRNGVTLEFRSDVAPISPSPPPVLGPSVSVREVFFSDFDRRLDVLGPNNPVIEKIQDFYQQYPNYWSPPVNPQYNRNIPWH